MNDEFEDAMQSSEPEQIEKPEGESVVGENSTVTPHRPLPKPLADCISKFLGGVFITLVLVVVCTIVLKQWKTVFFLLIPAYIGYKAFMVRKDWDSGVILEVSALCRSVHPAALRDQLSVSFTSYGEDEEPDGYYQFTIPSKKQVDDFIPNAPYFIYFRESEPHHLLAFAQI